MCRTVDFVNLIFMFSFQIKATRTIDPEVLQCLDAKGTCYIGTRMKSFDEKLISAFLGVPYAEPPTLNNRFTDPIKWSDSENVSRRFVDCKIDPPPCLYIDYRVRNRIYGDEDCLYMNIFTSSNLHDTNLALKAVLVEFADVDFERGDASSLFYGPEFIVTQGDMVLVTVNSRLGIFGYLAHEFLDVNVTGNFGLKDQQMALKWIYDNIYLFGGDRNRIIVAGGASVSYHLVNQVSSSMISRAIIRHSNFISPYNRPYEIKTEFKPIQLKTYSEHFTKVFPQKRFYQDFLHMNWKDLLLKIQSWNWTVCLGYPFYRFRPVVDIDLGAENPFLIDHPISIWSVNKFKFFGDVWYINVNTSAFDLLLPMFAQEKGLKDCDHITFDERGRVWWEWIEELFLTDFRISPNINLRLHEYYFRVKNLTAQDFYFLFVEDASKNGFFPLEQLFTWALFIFPQLKMIQLRPYNAWNRQIKRNFLTLYTNKARYRCFRPTYYKKSLCGDAVPVIGGTYDRQARGEELVYLYLMPGYFQTPPVSWLDAFVRNVLAISFFVQNGFSNIEDPQVPDNCHIQLAPLGEVDVSSCASMDMLVDDRKLVVTFRSKLKEEDRVQFNMWDLHLFGNLYFKEKVRDPLDD